MLNIQFMNLQKVVIIIQVEMLFGVEGLIQNKKLKIL